jgi:hypothetical protein
MATVEYLAIVQKSNSFCDSVNSFNRLLQVDSSIAFKAHKIAYKNDFECDYKITSGEIQGKEQRYFHLHFSTKNEFSDNLDKFAEFLKAIRAVLAKLDSQPTTLWDDISYFYCNSSYPLIHEIENLMRKLISNFMLITVGVDWVDQASPAEIKAILGKSKRKDLNALHNIDFKDLADFLLKPYSSVSGEELQNKIKKSTTPEDVVQLKRMLPESNWSRYFSNLVNCDDTFLQKRWMELYELRCRIAHNALVVKSDYTRVKELTSELKEKLCEAINKLPQVQVPSEEIALVSENAAASATSSLIWLLLSAEDTKEKNKISHWLLNCDKDHIEPYSTYFHSHLWKKNNWDEILNVAQIARYDKLASEKLNEGKTREKGPVDDENDGKDNP